MKKTRLLLTILLALAIGLLIYTPLARFHLLPDLGSLFTSKPPRIEETPVIIEQIKSIAQLFTQSYYDECIFDTGTILTSFFQSDKRLIIIARGVVIAGFDLSRIDANSLSLRGKSISVTLPPPRILDVIVNPSGYETFLAQGDITFQERIDAQEKAKKMIEVNALKKGILQNSGEQGARIMEKFFQLLGFEQIQVRIAKELF